MLRARVAAPRRLGGDVKAMAESPGQALEMFWLLSPYGLSAQPCPRCSGAASPAQGSCVAIDALCVAVSGVNVGFGLSKKARRE